MLGIEGLKDASMKGDERWYRTNRFTAGAPWLVLALSILSITQIAVGAVWISSWDGGVSFGGFIQPMVVPGLSFFNALPSLNLHVFARLNPPRLALVFSTLLALLYLVSAALYLGACVPATRHDSLQRDLCPADTGGPRPVWAVQVALEFASALGYALHAAMAAQVRKTVAAERGERRARRARGEETELDRVKKAREREEAKERWKHVAPG